MRDVEPAPLHLTLAYDLRDLATAQRAAVAWLEALGAGRNLCFDVQLVIEEIVTNLLKYARLEDPARRITVQVALHDGHVVVRFEDDGPSFDPRNAPVPDLAAPLEERIPGGLGLHLVRTVAERIEYRSEGRVNRLEVRLREPLPLEPQP